MGILHQFDPIRTLTDVAHDGLDKSTLVCESLALDSVSGKGGIQVLLGLLVGIGPLLILVTSKCGALGGILGFFQGKTVRRFAIKP